MRKWLVFLLTLVLSLPLPLMAEEAVQQVLGAANEQQASSQQANPQVHENSDDYFLGTGDRIEIIVYGEPDMSMKFKVSKSGVVNFPYIGEVVIAGRTPSAIETEIEERLRGDYLLNPMVTINMESFRLFYIFGEVTSPNGYEFQPRLTVEQAIAIAGGFTDRADRDDISIRSGATNEVIEDVELTHPVQPGDTVIVEQSFF
jgi:polysaccharide export outer membrane protein